MALTPYQINHLIKHGFDPFDKAIKKSQKPVEYITGIAEFWSRDFIVNKNVLIPRLETEKLVELVLKEIKKTFDTKAKRAVSILDLATGSGVIGITLALELENLKVPFNVYITDISKAALKVAETNIKRLSPKNISVLHSDLFKNIKKNTDAKFDFIVANLPYVPSNRISHLSQSVKDFEPKIALDGGQDGLKFIKTLLKQAKSFITPNGTIILEVDDTHSTDVATRLGQLYHWNIEVIKDHNEKIRYWKAQLL